MVMMMMMVTVMMMVMTVMMVMVSVMRTNYFQIMYVFPVVNHMGQGVQGLQYLHLYLANIRQLL